VTRHGERARGSGGAAGRKVAPAARRPGVLRRVDAPRLRAPDAAGARE